MNTTQTDNGKKQETAKEILRRYGIHELPADEVRDILAFAKEIADKAWEAAGAWYVLVHDDHPDKTTFMKELFPEDIKDTSASG